MATLIRKLKGGVQSITKVRGCEPIPEPGKEAYMRFGCSDGVKENAPFIHTLKWQLANSYYWSGSFCRDYFFFVANWHPLFGLFLSHPNHPWTKRERFTMLLVSFTIVMVPSAMIGKEFKEDSLDQFGTIVTFVTIPDCVTGVILYQVSISETRLPRCACCLAWLTRAMFCFALSFGTISTAICYFILTMDTDASPDWVLMLRPLIQGMITGWITWFPIWFLLPCQLGFISLWCAEKDEARSGRSSSDEGDGSQSSSDDGA